jgi:hypothetical protein
MAKHQLNDFLIKAGKKGHPGVLQLAAESSDKVAKRLVGENGMPFVQRFRALAKRVGGKALGPLLAVALTALLNKDALAEASDVREVVEILSGYRDSQELAKDVMETVVENVVQPATDKFNAITEEADSRFDWILKNGDFWGR